MQKTSTVTVPFMLLGILFNSLPGSFKPVRNQSYPGIRHHSDCRIDRFPDLIYHQ